MKNNEIYKFGRFRLEAEKCVLWHEDRMVPLKPKALETLLALVRRSGEVVTKDEIMREVWADSFVEENSLSRNVYELRKTLKQFGGKKFIETVPRRGYRFAGQVSAVVSEAHDLVIERQTFEQTVIEDLSEEAGDSPENHDGRVKYAENENDALPPAAIFRIPFPVYTIAFILLAGLVTGFAVWRYQNAGVENISLPEIGSIAVLPLKSFPSGSEDESLRLRITDALITGLGSLERVAVRPTNSVLPFSGETQDAVAAGRKLAVDAVLDGRLQTENGRLRVTLQLISVDSGEQVWAEQFDGKTGETLALQDAITDRLREKFAFAETSRSVPRPAANNEAYEAYLKGRYLWNQRTAESYWKALEYFRQSIKADPNFALGYTGISDCYHLLQQRNLLSAGEAASNAELAARKALELDPNLAQAHTSMAAVSFLYYSRWAEAERYYLRAIELNPNYAEARAWYGMMLNARGRFDEAFAELKKAEQLDPTSLNIAIYLGANFYFSKQFDRATAQFRQILDFAPHTERAHFFLSRIYEINGKYDEAVESALKERAVASPPTVEPLRLAYQRAGIRGFWQKQIEILKEESKTMHGLETHIASRYVLLGDADRAFEYLEKDFKIRGHIWDYARVDPAFDPIRGDARFREILRKMDAVSDAAPNEF